MIIFGSVLRREFVCDTVFVVADFAQHTETTWNEQLHDVVSDAVIKATIEPMYVRGNGSYTLYLGATRAEPVDGMYSFVPCRPVEDEPLGFARPSLHGRPESTAATRVRCRST